MVGNSLKSDVIPALKAGAWAVHVPHELTWAYEQAETPLAHSRFREIAHLGALPGLIDEIPASRCSPDHRRHRYIWGVA